MSVKKLTVSKRFDIACDYNRGLYSQQELADKYGVSRATVRRAIGEYEWYFGENPEEESGRPILEESGLFGPVSSEEAAESCIRTTAYVVLACLFLTIVTVTIAWTVGVFHLMN